MICVCQIGTTWKHIHSSVWWLSILHHYYYHYYYYFEPLSVPFSNTFHLLAHQVTCHNPCQVSVNMERFWQNMEIHSFSNLPYFSWPTYPQVLWPVVGTLSQAKLFIHHPVPSSSLWLLAAWWKMRAISFCFGFILVSFLSFPTILSFVFHFFSFLLRFHAELFF